YNAHRPHRSLNLTPPTATDRDQSIVSPSRKVKRRDRLGGLIHQYSCCVNRLCAPHRYEERGSGEPLVLLHGGLSDARFFHANVGPLAGRFRVLTPDERGHGRTPTFPARSPSTRWRTTRSL